MSIRACCFLHFWSAWPPGSAPALQVGRKSLDSSLRERGGTPSGGLALRRAIVTAQIAFTLILVVAAGLFVRTLSGLLVKGPGFDTSSLISFGIKPDLIGYSGAEESRLIRRKIGRASCRERGE